MLEATKKKIDAHRDKASQAAYQAMLFGSAPAQLEVSAKRVFTYHKDLYPAHELYAEAGFRKHYYRAVGKMNGEEAVCARLIDSLPRISYWVRNLERQPDFSFWLPTPTDKFYPDYVAILNDERVLAVEYKGELSREEDNKEKIAIGNLWAERSNGQCLFLFVRKDDFESRLSAAAG